MDPGRELDYDENLDVQVTVTPTVEAEDDGDKESTLLEMIKTNPKLKRIFRSLVRDEQTQEKTLSVPNNDNAGKRVCPSLSDLTMYVPAMVRRDPEMAQRSPVLRNHVLSTGTIHQGATPVNQITSFLERVRMDEQGPGTSGEVRQHTADSRTSEDVRTEKEADRRRSPATGALDKDEQAVLEARETARTRIVEAEKFRAAVDLVPGTYNPDNDDDTFFLNTCHTDESHAKEIEKGHFVDMNKIYPRQNDYKGSLDTRLEIINKDGHTYFVPAGDSTKRVFNFHTWQKAFRVYATIYSKANPHRAAEILQYIDVIGNAASAFVWENVAAYDYIHRQLMPPETEPNLV